MMEGKFWGLDGTFTCFAHERNTVFVSCFAEAIFEVCANIGVFIFKTGRHADLRACLSLFLLRGWSPTLSPRNLNLKDVRSCFNRHRFQSLKLPKLVADMILHGWLKSWTRLPEWFLNFEELQITNFTRCHMDTNLKIPVFSVLWKK